MTPEIRTRIEGIFDPVLIRMSLGDTSPETIEKNLNKWGQYGFLQGLPEFTQMRLAGYYEATASRLTSVLNTSPTDDTLSVLESVVFPMLRRIEDVLTPGNLAEILVHFYEYLEPVIYRTQLQYAQGDPTRDYEAEFVTFFDAAVRIKYLLRIDDKSDSVVKN